MFEKFLNLLRNTGERLNHPLFGGFHLYLVLLWLLNIADIIQTVLLSKSGHLQKEANFLMEYFLADDWRKFIIAKILALSLVTAMVIRGYVDKKGTTIGNHYYSPADMRKAIVYLLGASVVYYLIIVLIPFLTIVTSIVFNL